MSKIVPVTILTGYLGAGKTTLINIITGLLMPTSGTVLFNGTAIGKNMQEYISQTFGFETEFKNFKIPKTFPLYLVSGYSYRECCIEDQEILFVTPVDFNLGSYKKHRLKIEELAQLCLDACHVVVEGLLVEKVSLL